MTTPGQATTQLREGILSAAEAVATASQFLLECVRAEPGAAGGEMRTDVEKMLASARGLYAYAHDHLLAAAAPSATAESAADLLAEVRHEIKNRLNVICGTCQLLMMDEPAEAIAAELNRIQRYADDCLKETERVGKDLLPHGPEEVEARRRELDTAGHEETPVISARVLVADDQEANREIMERFLKREGHVMTSACNGREVLERLAEADYDLLLLDIVMPEMSGFEVLEELRRRDLLKHMPVLVMSGLDDRHNILRCIEIGAEDFLARPIDVPLLRARVNACLEKKRLRERQLEQFFTPDLARALVRRPEILSEGRSAVVSVLFCDIRGFSAVSELLGAEETIRWLRDVLELFSACVMKWQGVLVDYIGDEVIAMWGAPNAVPDHALLACEAGREMLAGLPAIDEKWQKRIGRPTRAGVGVNTGEVFVGNIGTGRKLKYGPIGNAVNMASRVQNATKHFGCHMIVTDATHRELKGAMPSRRLGRVRVNNIEEPVTLHQIAPVGFEEWEALKEPYEKALVHFEEGEYHRTLTVLGRLFETYPKDDPSLLLVQRASRALRAEPGDIEEVFRLPK